MDLTSVVEGHSKVWSVMQGQRVVLYCLVKVYLLISNLAPIVESDGEFMHPWNKKRKPA